MNELVTADGVAHFPARFNLAEYFLDSNLEAGRGDKTALAVGSETQSYAALVERSRRLAAALRRAGVRPEERVLIALPDGFEFAETFFGILRAGGVFAMVNPLSKPDAFEEYLRYTKARVIVTHADVLPELAPAFEAVRGAETLLVVGGDDGGFTPYEQALASEDPGGRLAETEPTEPDDLAGWLFTSGSTGRPKACVHAQNDFAYSTETYAKRVVGYGENDVCLGVPKLFFGYATGTNLMFPLRFGGTAALFSERSTADALFDGIAEHRPTILTSVPTMIGNMLRSERLANADLSSLRLTLSAGEALPETLMRQWLERAGVEILDGIGAAETFHIYISNWPGDVRPGSLGKLVPGYTAQIVDAEDRPLGDGDVGRLRVHGESIALCYWANKQQSRSTFQGGWFTSADCFRKDAEGYFYYEGRADDLLKVSGIWVSPIEIENVLLDHPGVAEVCVLGSEDASGLTKPLAFVVCSAGVEGDDGLAAGLKDHCKQHLVPHKYPRWFEFRAELPKNDRGKIARKVLAAELAERNV